MARGDPKAVFDGLDLRRRNVDVHVTAHGRPRSQALEPLQARLQLNEPHRGGDVQCFDRRAVVDDAGRRQVVARLEFLYRRNDPGVIFAGNTLTNEVPGNLEPPLQDFDLLTARAGLHDFGRDRGPTALGDDGLIAANRGLGRFDIPGRKRR